MGASADEDGEESASDDVAVVIDLVKENAVDTRDTHNIGRSCGKQQAVCDVDERYRRIDGFCNNLENTEWGAAGRKLLRKIRNTYEDGSSIPRGGLIDSSLPSPREISAALHHEPPNPNNVQLTDKTPHPEITHMLMQFGHFIGHDVALSSQDELDCCHPRIAQQEAKLPDKLKRCFNIDISTDGFYSKAGRKCHTFTRSDSLCLPGNIREQFNSITSFIDGSAIYGSDERTAQKLRLGKDGQLLVNNKVKNPSLPTRQQCGFQSSGTDKPSDLAAGDERAIVQPALAAMHTLFMREHNKIAAEIKLQIEDFLKDKSKVEEDEIIYQETRRIIIAEMQNIVYNEYLPLVLGKSNMDRLNLDLRRPTTYDSSLDPSIMNEFATAAYRFGHSIVSGLFKPIGHKKWPLKFHYFDFKEFVLADQGNAFENELHGLAKQPCQKADLTTTDDMTDFLFFDKSSSSTVGDDIAARNIQRGRDHGIPTYNTMRAACKLAKLPSFKSSSPREISPSNWRKLASVYESVEDIDLFTGGLSETPQSGALVGPTFSCIIGKQFNSLLFGDRYFFTHDAGENHQGMSSSMQNMIKRRSLRDILCENTDIPDLQKFVMKKPSRKNPTSTCFSTNEIDFEIVVDDILSSNGKLVPTPKPPVQKPNPEPALKPNPPPIQKPQPKPESKPKPPPIQKPKPQPAPKPKPPPVQKPKPQPVPKPKPPPIQKPKPQPAPKPKPPPVQKPKPQPAPKPKPPVQKPRPNPSNTKCIKDKLSFCQWLIPKCKTSSKTRADCCKTCGGRVGK